MSIRKTTKVICLKTLPEPRPKGTKPLEKLCFVCYKKKLLFQFVEEELFRTDYVEEDAPTSTIIFFTKTNGVSTSGIEKKAKW